MFGTKTVDKILGAFHRVVEDLESLAGKLHQEVDEHNDEIQQLKTKVNEKVKEKARALDVALRLRELLK